MLGYLDDARIHGAPRPESQAIRAHVPAVIRVFTLAWQTTFREGVLDHEMKELCRVAVSQSIACVSQTADAEERQSHVRATCR